MALLNLQTLEHSNFYGGYFFETFSLIGLVYCWHTMGCLDLLMRIHFDKILGYLLHLIKSTFNKQMGQHFAKIYIFGKRVCSRLSLRDQTVLTLLLKVKKNLAKKYMSILQKWFQPIVET